MSSLRPSASTRDVERLTSLKLAKVDSRINQYTVGTCPFIRPNTLDKIEAILAIIRHHQPSRERILVFVNDAHAARIVSERCKTMGLTQKHLKGSANIIRKRLEEFESGVCPVLIVNGNVAGSGLNIHMADITIVNHVRSQQLLIQLIGRSQRPKRALNRRLVVYILSQLRALSKVSPPSSSSSSSAVTCAVRVGDTATQNTSNKGDDDDDDDKYE